MKRGHRFAVVEDTSRGGRNVLKRAEMISRSAPTVKPIGTHNVYYVKLNIMGSWKVTTYFVWRHLPNPVFFITEPSLSRTGSSATTTNPAFADES
jgi:hypothetical protein